MAEPALEFLARLTASTEVLTPEEAQRAAPFFTNTDRSVVAMRNLPEVIKGALFSRYSRSSKGVRRLFLDEFLGRSDLGLETFMRAAESVQAELQVGTDKAEAFYARVLSDYGDDSVGELGGAHLACQEISQLAVKAIEDNRIGLSYLEKSSRYVPFDDRVNGQYRYYRPQLILDSPFSADYVALMDRLFEAYARSLPRVIERLTGEFPIEGLEFENALTGEVARLGELEDEDVARSARFAYKQAVRARACDVLRSFLPLATLTNVGVWGNGRALEYLLVKLYADPLEEIRTLAHAAQHELDGVIGPFLRRTRDEKGQSYQEFLRRMHASQAKLARTHTPEHPPAPGAKVTLVRYDADAVDWVVASILYPATNWSKEELRAHVANLDGDTKRNIVCAYVGERGNRRHKPGRAFERAQYEFDLALNIGEYRDLQRQRLVSPERQRFTTALGYEANREIEALPEVRRDYEECMESADRLYRRLEKEMPFEAQYVVPYGYRVRYNVQLNLREAYHWIELRTSPQGHADYRRTSQEMFRAIQRVHPELVEPMRFVDLTPEIPLGRLRAEMRRAAKKGSG